MGEGGNLLGEYQGRRKQRRRECGPPLGSVMPQGEHS